MHDAYRKGTIARRCYRHRSQGRLSFWYRRVRRVARHAKTISRTDRSFVMAITAIARTYGHKGDYNLGFKEAFERAYYDVSTVEVIASAWWYFDVPKSL